VSWLVVIPFKGAPDGKSRLAGRFDDTQRRALALAFLQDTLAAVRGVPAVAGVTVVSSEPGLNRMLASAEGLAPAQARAPIEVIPDPGNGLNAAIEHGIVSFRGGERSGHIAVLLGDLPALASEELAQALAAAEEYPQAFVPDAAGDGTTMITLAPDVDAPVLFGAGSAAAHAAAGYVRLELAADSGLRRDVDAPEDVDALERPGRHTRAALQAL
jgi:2-phospho-L-lactate guanylyltransferase